MRRRLPRLLSSSAAALALAGCMVGPNYSRPTITLAPSFKEQGWTPIRPADLSARGDWWTIFNDPTLDALEARVNISNQNVAAAEAAYRQAQALVAEQRAALFPVVTLNASGTRTGTGAAGGSAVSTYRVNGDATWALDVWGAIRRSIEGARANAQASEATLAGARLSAQATLATDYFDLRQTDAQIALLTETVTAYKRSLKIASDKYNAAIAPHSDVLQAQSLLATTQAQLVNLGNSRAAFEHAIAVLSGQTPETFSLPPDPKWSGTIPPVPPTIPSALLERRPDVATAERQAASASAQIGVQVAAYFPNVTLTGSGGFLGAGVGHLFTASNSVWSYGVSAAETLFNAGLTSARVRAARATYDQTVALYRQTVLAALQQVEDQLAATRVLADEHDYRQSAANDADLAATMVLNQYREGQVDYTSVVTAQVNALSAKQAVVQLVGARQNAAVALIQAIGGGWSAPF